MTMEKRLAELKLRLREINDLESAGAVLAWDQSTYMPLLHSSRSISQLPPDLLS